MHYLQLRKRQRVARRHIYESVNARAARAQSIASDMAKHPATSAVIKALLAAENSCSASAITDDMCLRRCEALYVRMWDDSLNILPLGCTVREFVRLACLKRMLNPNRKTKRL